MRRLLIAAAVASTVLTAMPPAEAKSIWLKCGTLQINLDSSKERYSLTQGTQIYQGAAIFSPSQINFEYRTLVDGAGGMKEVWAINRKTLAYTGTTMAKHNNSLIEDKSWKLLPGISPNPESGKCSIMKTPPTAGNQI